MKITNQKQFLIGNLHLGIQLLSQSFQLFQARSCSKEFIAVIHKLFSLTLYCFCHGFPICLHLIQTH